VDCCDIIRKDSTEFGLFCFVITLLLFITSVLVLIEKEKLGERLGKIRKSDISVSDCSRKK
jgi:hypothetical protein